MIAARVDNEEPDTVALGKTAGVSGYVSSRYCAMTEDSETAFPVLSSYMNGMVYRSLPSGFFPVGGPPTFLQTASISG